MRLTSWQPILLPPLVSWHCLCVSLQLIFGGQAASTSSEDPNQISSHSPLPAGTSAAQASTHNLHSHCWHCDRETGTWTGCWTSGDRPLVRETVGMERPAILGFSIFINWFLHSPDLATLCVHVGDPSFLKKQNEDVPLTSFWMFNFHKANLVLR